MDIATLIDGDAYDAMAQPDKDEYDKLVNSRESARPELLFGCHTFVVSMYPPGHPYHLQYLEARRYWDWEWSRDRRDHVAQKGYLIVEGGEA